MADTFTEADGRQLAIDMLRELGVLCVLTDYLGGVVADGCAKRLSACEPGSKYRCRGH